MSSAGGPNSEVAKLSIGIEATGADATVNKLQQVEQQAKQTQQAIQTSTISGPQFTGVNSSISLPGMVPGGAGAVRDAAMDWSSYTVKLDAATEARQRFIQSNVSAARSTTQLTEAATGLSAALRPLTIFTRIAGALGFLTAALSQGYEGIIKYRNAAGDLNDELKKIGDGFKVNTTFGASEADTLRKQADAAKEAALQAEKLRMASRGYREGFMETIFGESSNKAILQQIDSQHAAALEQIAVREKNQRDKDAADKEAQLAKEQAAYDEDLAKRQENYRQSVLIETEQLRKQALQSEMSDREKVIADYEDKAMEVNRRIAEAEDVAIQNSLRERLGYLAQLRDAQLKAIDERAAAESAKAKESADAIATAFNEAVGSAITQNQERIAQMFDSTALLQRFDGIASALEVLGRQRGIR